MHVDPPSPEFSRNLLAAIVDSSDDAIVSKDLNGIITSWNKGAERVFGYAADEIIGKPVLTLIPPDRREEEPRILQRLRAGERDDHFDTIRVRKNGEMFPVTMTISPLRDASGMIVGDSRIARDISDRQKLQRERHLLLDSERNARQQAEAASRMKDEFLAVVSHELRTPLNAIVGWTEVLAQGGASREEVVEGIEVIKRNALVQAQIIEDILDLGRIVSGKMKLSVEPVDLATIVRDAITSVRHAAAAKEISIKQVINDTRGVLMGDSKRLQQIVWNLLSNAIKFTPKRGRILVTALRVNSHVDLSVEDNGAGIAAEFLPRVFDRFSQADASTSRRTGGLGIGLALVKQLVELHGGTVRAESGGVGAGAKFTVSLPVAAAHGSAEARSTGMAEAEAAFPLADLAGVRVLAIDDDADSLEVLRRILSGRNAEIQVADSVADAMAVLDEFSPDVVLSDIGMPEHDGFEFIRRLRQHPRGAGIPAAALTALTRPVDRTRALHAGFQTHIAKPVAASELVAVVRSLASLSHQSRRAAPSS